MKLTVRFSDGTVQVLASTTSTPGRNVPGMVVPPDCLEVVLGLGRLMALQMIDESYDSRGGPLPETNMVFPNRPVDEDGETVLERVRFFLARLVGYRVSPQGKVIMNLHLHPEWWAWTVDCIGERNAINFRAPGDGLMDTNEPDSDDLKLMSAVFGGGVLEVLEEHVQAGTKWCVIRTLDFDRPPERRADGWYYLGERLEYRTHPHLFWVRTNRKKIGASQPLTWLTSGGINISNDVGVEGGKGHEVGPLIARGKVAQRRADLWYFPSVPFETQIYRESLVVDGILVPQEGGISAWITKLRFHGPDVYGWDSRSGGWYLLSQMLVRGSLERRDGGNGYDWRLYAKAFLSRRAVGAPDCGWLRP